MNKPFTVEILKSIKAQSDGIDFNTDDEHFEYIAELFNKHCEQWYSEQSGWVKCSDRLPTTFLPTYNGTKSNPLVLLDDQGSTTIGRFFIQYYDGGKIESFYNEFEDEITGVTHYIELPEFP